MIVNDSLKQALIRIDSLQQQINIKTDSLTKISHKYQPAILEERLQQASDTVSNLSSLSTGFGTMYTVIGIIIAVLTLGIGIVIVVVPIWLGNKTDRAILAMQNDFNTKLTTLQSQHDLLQDQIADENLALSENFRREFDQQQIIFQSSMQQTEDKNAEGLNKLSDLFDKRAKKLKRDYTLQNDVAWANILAHMGMSYLDRENYGFSSGAYILSAFYHIKCKSLEPANSALNVVIYNLDKIEQGEKKEEIEIFDQVISNLSAGFSRNEVFEKIKNCDNEDIKQSMSKIEQILITFETT